VNSSDTGLFFVIKATHDKLRAKIILNEEKTEIISSKVRDKTRVSTLSALIHYNSGILATTARQEKERKEICIEKEEAKVALFKDDMIWYLNVPKNSTKKLLDLINTFSTVAGCKINI
jgi:hypothetical protein